MSKHMSKPIEEFKHDEIEWYRNAIFYLFYVEIYSDSDGDGIGDLQGLIARLPYLADLGITCLWLMPFYPSLSQDDGYAVNEYLGVEKGLGCLDDFRELINQAHKHKIRVIIDLVANHSSNQHHWFQDALNNPHSKFHDFYVWSKERPEEMAPKVIFPGEQKSNWTYNKVAQAYYWHYYYDFQPGLNYANHNVRKEVQNIIEFWMNFGVDGFRLDSLPMMISKKGLPETEPENPHQLLKFLVASMKMHDPEAIFLAEANVVPDELPIYFGDDDEMNLLYNFYANSYFFLALVRQDATTLRRAWQKYAEVLSIGRWLNFMRSHDELSIERLTKAEQKEVVEAFAPEEDWRIYNRGIRCRLPRVLGDDRRKLELAYSFAFALPGTPLLLYGEEIGMGDNLALKGRMATRVPMHWSNEKNGGFSDADPVRLVRPVITSGKYAYRKINVADQQKDPDSFLNWMKKLIQVRKQYPLFGVGKFDLWDPQNDQVFALFYDSQIDHKAQQLLTLHNLSGKVARVEVEQDGWQAIWSDSRSPAHEGGSTTVELAPFGYVWLCRKDGHR